MGDSRLTSTVIDKGYGYQLTSDDDDSVDVLTASRKHWILALSITLVFGLVAGVVGYYRQPNAEAKGVVGLVAPSNTNPLASFATSDSMMSRYTAQRASFAASDRVIGMIAGETGQSISEVRNRIEIEASPTTNVFTIRAVANTPQKAVDLAEKLVASYRTATREEIQASGQAAAESYRLAGDLSQAARVTASSDAFGDGVSFVEAATLGSTDSRSIPVKDVALGILIGLLIGVLTAWSQEDRAMRRRKTTASAGADKPDARNSRPQKDAVLIGRHATPA